jgi:hypothetical protein
MIGNQSKACHWLEALQIGVDQQFSSGVQGQGLHRMSDNACQPTAVSSITNGNANTERFIRAIKEACLWLQE